MSIGDMGSVPDPKTATFSAVSCKICSF